MAKIKLRHISGKIVEVERQTADNMVKNNPGKYQEVKAKKEGKTKSKDSE